MSLVRNIFKLLREAHHTGKTTYLDNALDLFGRFCLKCGYFNTLEGLLADKYFMETVYSTDWVMAD